MDWRRVGLAAAVIISTVTNVVGNDCQVILGILSTRERVAVCLQFYVLVGRQAGC